MENRSDNQEIIFQPSLHGNLKGTGHQGTAQHGVPAIPGMIFRAGGNIGHAPENQALQREKQELSSDNNLWSSKTQNPELLNTPQDLSLHAPLGWFVLTSPIQACVQRGLQWGIEAALYSAFLKHAKFRQKRKHRLLLRCLAVPCCAASFKLPYKLHSRFHQQSLAQNKNIAPLITTWVDLSIASEAQLNWLLATCNAAKANMYT